MESIIEYIRGTLGSGIRLQRTRRQELEKLPFFIKGLYQFSRATFLGRDLVIAEHFGGEPATTTQILKQMHTIGEAFRAIPVLASTSVSSGLRSRLIEHRVNFVVPGKQLFLPDLLLDLREKFSPPQIRKETLLPSAQVILLCWMLRQNRTLGTDSQKQLAERLGYTPMAITNAVADLARWNLCEVAGKKEKHLRFLENREELWHQSLPRMMNPVERTICIDHFPKNMPVRFSHMSALAHYADINEDAERRYAIGSKTFRAFRPDCVILPQDDWEDRPRLELWKYDPALLTVGTKNRGFVDPLSLYLSLRDSPDERIHKAIDQAVGGVAW